MSSDKSGKVSRSLLNVDVLDAFIAYLCAHARTSAHSQEQASLVETWLRGTFRRWLQNESPHVRIAADESERRSPMYLYHSTLALESEPHRKAWYTMHSMVHFLSPALLPEWAKEKFATRNLYVFDIKAGFDNSEVDAPVFYEHVVDFLAFEGPSYVKASVPDVLKQVSLWDRRIARQKLIGALSDGVKHIDSFKHESLVLVRLISEDAYKNEGTVMRHCVAGYYGKTSSHSSSRIYSLRSVDSPIPLATIEMLRRHHDGSVFINQMLGYKNTRVSDELINLMHEWAQSTFKTYVKKNLTTRAYDDDDEYDENDEEEEEYDEDEDQNDPADDDDEFVRDDEPKEEWPVRLEPGAVPLRSEVLNTALQRVIDTPMRVRRGRPIARRQDDED